MSLPQDNGEKLHGNTRYCVAIFRPDPIYYVIPVKSCAKIIRKTVDDSLYVECHCEFTIDELEETRQMFIGRIIFAGKVV